MNGCVILHISCSIFSNGGKRGSIFRNEWVYDLGTSAVPYLVIGARGVPYFVINGHAILTHKGPIFINKIRPVLHLVSYLDNGYENIKITKVNF